MAAANPIKQVGHRLLKGTNWVLLLMQFMAGLALALSLASRETFVSISRTIYGEDAPLMGSVVADLLLRPELGIVVLAVFIASVWKERVIVSLPRRAVINSAIIALLMLLQAYLMLWMYAPVFISPEL